MTMLLSGTLLGEFFGASMEYIDLSNNSFEGSIPSSIGNLSSLETLMLHSNKFIGEIPPSICRLPSLQFLHLSNNNLEGSIPECLGEMSKSLQLLHLKKNLFHGVIPPTFAEGCSLESLNLNGNLLEGTLPQSLVNCGNLQVLDIGNNDIEGMFPFWMDTLVELRVLVLRSNKFNGTIIPEAEISDAPFRKLQVLDISHNNFGGFLPNKYFMIFQAMVNAKENKTQVENWFSKYEESMEFVLKGVERSVERILTTFTTIDMSDNNFFGSIPESIGNLSSLRYLNLSHNSLSGYIPSSLGNVKELESLDLSSNHLTGKIPWQLIKLNFLSTLNLSMNDLVGQIPQSSGQFPTFDNSSYIWNSELCGFPLTKKCEIVTSPLPQQNDEDTDFIDGFTWKAVVSGYGCGFVIGVIVGGFIIHYRRPKWFLKPFFGVR